MAEKNEKSSPDETWRNDSKVFGLFCVKSVLIWLGDRYTGLFNKMGTSHIVLIAIIYFIFYFICHTILEITINDRKIRRRSGEET